MILIISKVIAAMEYTGKIYPIRDSFDLNWRPIKKYPATDIDPDNAKMSPINLCTPCPKSLIAIIVEPRKANISPINIFLVILSFRKKCDIMATNSGFVVTRTTDTATDVNSKDFIHARKWIANRIPDSIAYFHWFLLSDFISFR